MSFTFSNPGQVRIRVRASDQDYLVDTKTSIWSWRDGGVKFTINWDKLKLHPILTEIAKAFVFYRLQTNSPTSIYSNEHNLLVALSRSTYGSVFPWDEKTPGKILNEFYGTKEFTNFRVFYKWCVKRQVPGFSRDIELRLPTNAGRIASYEKVRLAEINLTSEDEYRIWHHIESVTPENSNYSKFRNNVILHLVFELAPRPIQIFSLDEGDLEFYSSSSGDDYFTLWLPMAKKRTIALPDKRPRKITKSLGYKIKHLIELNKLMFKNVTKAMFLSDDGELRLPTPRISLAVSEQLKELSFQKGDGITTLRHHLGQSLADQGASAETIAEILGHNSTVPARAYIAATPEIATIKSRALGKNSTYLNIMKMMLTGEIIDRTSANKKQWVKGMVGSQYIGGIGMCGLSESTPCPKNPVYSCYTCNKFHPFQDGEHKKVRTELENQAQYFIDTASAAMSLENNRAVSQLELTINAVNGVINRCDSINQS